MNTIHSLNMYARFALGLGPFLKETLSRDQSREMIRERLKLRKENFLTLVDQAIYKNQNSPYRALLDQAGCQFGDLKKMVEEHGIKTTLMRLKQEGVYITCDEFKGKDEIIRSGRTFRFSQSDFDNPLLTSHLQGETSASRSSGTRTIYDFNFISANFAAYMSQMISAYKLKAYPFAIWFPIMPGAGPLALLSYAKANKTPAKWFVPVQADDFKPSLRNRMGTAYVLFVGNLLRKKFPQPEYVSVGRAGLITRWIYNMIQKHGGCFVSTYTTLALRICQEASLLGIDLTGATFIGNGEPLTRAKRKEIHKSGARIYPIYATMEAGMIGLGCCHSKDSDVMHLLRDCVSLIQHTRSVKHAGMSVNAFLLTTLQKESPKIMLNVETGDYGNVSYHKCGCHFQTLGLHEYLSQVRSFEKLTGEGMSFFSTNLLDIIENELPSRFGGIPSHYQMGAALMKQV